MSFNQQIGLHLRLKDTLLNVAQEALEYKIKAFQLFLIAQKTEKYITLDHHDLEAFLHLKREHFSEVYIHSSYWINPASSSKEIFAISKHLLKKEIKLAKKLEIRYLVLHAGSAKGHRCTEQDPIGKERGIQALASMLNSVLKKEENVQILLENCAHGKSSIGNDFNDFALLKKELDHPEKIGFCVDFAHAFSFGYDLHPADAFVDTLDKELGLDNIKLIHFNDLIDPQGSMHDRHAFPGHGQIGKDTLATLLNHPLLSNIPKIIESPDSDQASIASSLHEVSTW